LRRTTSPRTGKVYPLKLLCQVLGVPRSTVYAQHACEPRKRGPKTVLSDDDLLVLIRDDLAKSPFLGEGHRKVWARLRRRGVRVSKDRILAVMRAHHLLAPTHRVHVHGDKAHTGTIIAQGPNQLWGTDATRLWTEDEGWCWLFLAVDHFNDEIVGWHVSERGDRFAAVEPVRQGVRRRFGAVGKDIARGLKLRMDHGSQYMARDFRYEVRFLGMEASPAFVSEPQGNGIAERAIGLVKEQAIWGQHFQTLEDAKKAIGGFIARYNADWLIERLKFRSPIEARQAEVGLS
jgi:putative transposase